MGSLRPYARRFAAPLVALGLVFCLFGLSREPAPNAAESVDLAARFRFERLPISRVPAAQDKSIRAVHPSLRHVAAMVSYVGASVALADLDGDGLPNDIVHIDPRTDLVVVAPVPGTEASRKSYEPFALNPAPLAYVSATMAPTGCLVGDFNEDGFPDILVSYWGRSPILFLRKPLGGQPVALLSAASYTPYELIEPYERWFTCAASQADLDGDGHLDLLIGNYFADGARILDAEATGAEQLPHSFSRAFNGGRKHFFLWEHPDRQPNPFRKVDAGLEEELVGGWTFALGAADLDGDLLPEIYFVQDFGPDRLFHNRSASGELRLALAKGRRDLTTPRSKTLGWDSFNGMGMDFGDLNGDGRPDLFVSNITTNYGLHESHFVFLSTGDVDRFRDGVAPYEDHSERLGLSRSGWAWEARLADFDNDGVLEAMQAMGATRGQVNRWPELQELALGNDQFIHSPRAWHPWKEGDNVSGDDRTAFFVRGGNGRYIDVGPQAGFGEPTLSRGIALADVDGDGLLDLAIANQWGPSFFYRNTAPGSGTFLGLNLRLPVEAGKHAVFSHKQGRAKLDTPTRSAVGAEARVHLPDGRVLVSQVDGGTGHSGKRSPELHFGLGKLALDSKLKVQLRWRTADSDVREIETYLNPGWHTVVLGAKERQP